MKPARGIAVVSLSASVIATSWAVGTGFLSAPSTAPLALAPATAYATVAPATASAKPAQTDATAAGAQPSSTASPQATTKQPPKSAGVSGTFDGSSASTPYGDFQVELVVKDGKVSKVSMLQAGEWRGESRQINQVALPILMDEVLKAQSWKVDAVSGASYSTDAVVQSVKSAMQQAGLA